MEQEKQEEKQNSVDDLGLVVMMEEEVLWNKVKTNSEKIIEELEKELKELPGSIKVNKEILSLANSKLSSIHGSEKS